LLGVNGLKVVVNGKEENVAAGTTVAGLVAARGLRPDTVIIEYNYGIVKKAEWDGIVLKENDRVEILRFVGGG